MDEKISKLECQKNGLSNQWTTTRCHRLLRPLLTHVAALRKEVGWQHAACPEEILLQRNHDFQQSFDLPSGKRRASNSIILYPRKKIRKTYSLKSGRHVATTQAYQQQQGHSIKGFRVVLQDASRDGIALPTPVIQRVRGLLTSSPSQLNQTADNARHSRIGRCQHSRECGANRCIFEAGLATIRRSVSPSLFCLYESIFRALDALLRATSVKQNQQPPSKGARSLLEMCLSKVPDYIGELEQWKRRHTEARGWSSSMEIAGLSFEVYSELESLGTGDHGWKHLVTTVRSHGISIIKAAIEDEIIDLRFAILLARLCNECQSFNDRAQLVQAIVSRQYSKPTDSEAWFSRTNDTLPLEIFLPSSDRTWIRPFRACTMSDLLSSKLLPGEWILTRDFGTIWSLTVRELVCENFKHNAVIFISKSIQLLCSHITSSFSIESDSYDEHDDNALQTLCSALGVLVAMVCVGHQTIAQTSSELSKDRIMRMNRTVELILRMCLASSLKANRSVNSLSTYVLLLAIFFFGTSSASLINDRSKLDKCQSLLEAFWNRPEGRKDSHHWRQQYNATMYLISSTAKCCSRGSDVPASAYIAELCDKIAILRVRSNQLKHLPRDAAFLVADQTGDLRDLAFAEDLGVPGQPPSSRNMANATTPGKRTAFAGFRWDEGISEWVTASPVITPKLNDEPHPDSPETPPRNTCLLKVEPQRRKGTLLSLVSSPVMENATFGNGYLSAGSRADGGASRSRPLGFSPSKPNARRTKQEAPHHDHHCADDVESDLEDSQDEVDELWAGGGVDQENRAAILRAPTAKRRNRRAAPYPRRQRQPLQSLSNQYDGSSGDELGF